MAAASFPSQKPKWADLSILRQGTLPARAHFLQYTSKGDALSHDSSKAQSVLLSGKWKFDLAGSPFEAPEDITSADFKTTSWKDIDVPGIWQLQGFGKGPQYVNMQYPFHVDPPHPPYENNETGTYVRTFEVPKSFSDQQLRLRFEGVDSSASVFLNGKELGYSQGARNPFEFDVTDAINHSGTNTLGVQVYQFCDGSYLEDQDQWRFSGIFRDVHLVAFPKEHIQDFQVKTLLDEKYEDATLSVSIEVQGSGDVKFELSEPSASTPLAESTQNVKDSKATFEIPVKNPHKWTAETPYLYDLVLTYGKQVIAQRIGFRKIEIKNSIYLVNGQKVVFRGANRHEHHPLLGRAVPYDFMKADLLLMKRHNINAIRTCHQPSDVRLYDLCDELGIWLMDEADVECHGFSQIEEMALPEPERSWPYWDKKLLLNKINGRYTSDNPEWTASYVDRAHQLVSRDKNHPSIVMWSLGNEAFYGSNFQAMYDAIKSVDDTRPIHYEGDLECETVDLYSRMYPSVEEIVSYAEKEGEGEKEKLPLILCEYVHAMGTGPGAIKEYIEAFYKHPSLMGGFEWEWANHGLLTKTADGKDEFYGYGGDFGDVPNDYNFVMDGMLYSDHTPNPGLLEYAKAIEPVQVLGGDVEKIQIVNRYDYIDLGHLRATLTVVGDGLKQEVGEVTIPTVSPGQTAELKLPKLDPSTWKTETYLELAFSLADTTSWAPAGHVVATGQVRVKGPTPFATPAQAPSPLTITTPTKTTLHITAEKSSFTFDLVHGKLTSWLKKSSNTELIHSSRGPELTIYRALTDNDRPQDGADWLTNMVNLASTHSRGLKYTPSSSTSDTHTVTITVESLIAPPVLSWSIATTTTYTISSSGTLKIHIRGLPAGKNLPRTFPRFGFEFAIPTQFDTVEWFGRGPGESYSDFKESQKFGNYKSTVNGLWVLKEFPQETANRTDVRWVELASPSGLLKSRETIKASFGEQNGFSFHASHFETGDVDKATHPFELEKLKKEYVVLRLDGLHHGIGTGSCGPKTREEYALGNGEFEFEVLLE